MKPLYLSIVAFLFLATFTPAFALEQPRIVPRANEVPKPIDEVFTRLKKYFSDPMNHFQLVSADPKTHTIYTAAQDYQPVVPNAPPPPSGGRGRGPAPVPDTLHVLIYGAK